VITKAKRIFQETNFALEFKSGMKSIGSILVALALAISPNCFAQDSSASNSSWTASSQQQGPDETVNPVRTSETHTQAGGRIVDNKSVETLGPDGRYVPYQDIEKESVHVDANTVRTIERTFGRDTDGRRTLVQVREEESRNLAGGAQSVTRTVLNPDANGRLQIVQRELQDSRQTSPDVRETKTTVLTPDVNGGLTPAVQIEERQTQSSDGSVEFKKSTLLSDGTGRWQLAEVREGTIKKENGQQRSTEENVSRPDSNGKLVIVEHTVSKQTETGSGEKRDTTETYSVNVPGVAGDDGLQLVQRETTVHRNTGAGGQTTTKKIEQRNPGNPDGGLQLTNEAIDIVRPSAGGQAEQQSTILTRDSDGKLREVWVGFGKTDKPPATPADSSTPTSAKPK
jgi:hypothetical protein